jgi:hypothetical protein
MSTVNEQLNTPVNITSVICRSLVAMEVYEGVEVQLHMSLNLALKTGISSGLL